MFGHGHSTDLSQVSVYGLHYNRPSSDADDLNLYVYFEVEGESSSTGTIKGLPGSSVEWSGDNIHFKQKHSTSSPLQVLDTVQQLFSSWLVLAQRCSQGGLCPACAWEGK